MSVLTGPPEIDGFEFLEPLGAGGFADVYLYEQELPRRTVAVKVLRGDDVGEQAVAAFLDEANVMAQLSAHPSIVTIHSAGLLPEDRRPYLVLEHCPRGNLGTRFRTETFSVQEALAIGIQLAGALETGHRAGILHRDIKPQNILITALNRPALTDFGIAVRLGSTGSGEEHRMSVPWSAPEVVEGSWSGPASDVYALAASVYSLLAGRSPFESPTGSNEVPDYAWRILHDELPPIGRPDVPASLEQVLATAMSRSPHGRHTSALSFARALQKVERELGLAVTEVDVLDNGYSALAAPVGAGLPLRPSPPASERTPTPDWSLQTVASGLPAALASVPAVATPPDPAANLPAPQALALAMSVAAPPGPAQGTAPADLTLVMKAGDAEPLAPDVPPSSALESLGLGTASPVDAEEPGEGPAAPQAGRRPVWPAVLVDLVLLAAVAAAGAVYLSLH